MTTHRVVTVLGLLVLALPAFGAAQSLGDVAAREKAKRTQKAKAEARRFTNEDLDQGRPPSAPAGEASDAPPATSSDPAPSPDDRAARERPYLDAIGAAEAQVASIEARLKELAEKTNPMSGSFIFGATGSNDANEDLRVREEMREAESQLVEARRALAAANQSLQDFRQGRASAPSETVSF